MILIKGDNSLHATSHVSPAWHPVLDCFYVDFCYCLQCFDAVGWAVGRACKKTERCGACVVICLERGADLHTAQLMQLPLTVSCFSKIQIDFTFLVPAHLGSPGQRAVKRMYVCMYVLLLCIIVIKLPVFVSLPGG